VAEVWIPESGEKAQRRTAAGGPVTRMATDSALAEDFEGCRCKPSTFPHDLMTGSQEALERAEK